MYKITISDWQYGEIESYRAKTLSEAREMGKAKLKDHVLEQEYEITETFNHNYEIGKDFLLLNVKVNTGEIANVFCKIEEEA